MPPSQSIGASVPNPSEFHFIHFLPCLSSLFPFFSPWLSLLVKMVVVVGCLILVMCLQI